MLRGGGGLNVFVVFCFVLGNLKFVKGRPVIKYASVSTFWLVVMKFSNEFLSH